VFHALERNLGKLLFPRSERWQQRRKMRIVFAVLLVELVAAGVILGALFLMK
jgi:hypothetical protein